ncbi:MAG: hypothetical protein K0R94_803 [Burkholderiales bacterium]|jgi:hypothetical protein|nr:hypothetical protein [Burkholderiales bacterium]
MEKLVTLVLNEGNKQIPESELKDGDIIKEDGKYYEMQEYFFYSKDENGKIIPGLPPKTTLLKVITFA